MSAQWDYYLGIAFDLKQYSLAMVVIIDKQRDWWGENCFIANVTGDPKKLLASFEMMMLDHEPPANQQHIDCGESLWIGLPKIENSQFLKKIIALIEKRLLCPLFESHPPEKIADAVKTLKGHYWNDLWKAKVPNNELVWEAFAIAMLQAKAVDAKKRSLTFKEYKDEFNRLKTART